jgi:hypothetical protein
VQFDPKSPASTNLFNELKICRLRKADEQVNDCRGEAGESAGERSGDNEHKEIAYAAKAIAPIG